MKKFYGYKHWTTEETPRCFNVGKGLQKRPTCSRGRNHKWRSIVRRYGLRVEVCLGPVTHEEACAWEIENIALMGTFSTNHSHDDLTDIGCNFTKGGDGGAGRIWTPESRLKARLAKIGKHPSEATLVKMKQAAQQRSPYSAETRQRMRVAALLREERKRS